MAKEFKAITPDLAEWLNAQKVFFVATSPLAADGLINCSPNGMDSFRILGPSEIAYLDLTGSGIETAANLRENGRILFIFCAFSGAPNIIRLHGKGEFIPRDSEAFERLRKAFPDYPGARGIVRARLKGVSSSCGFGVPRYDFQDDRDTLVRWAKAKGPDKLAQYRRDNNSQSLNNLPGIDLEWSGENINDPSDLHREERVNPCTNANISPSTNWCLRKYSTTGANWHGNCWTSGCWSVWTN